MEHKIASDFKHIQFLRNPIDHKNLNYIALDYFDYINVETANSLHECMLMENKIPCEAYQSLTLFKDSFSLTSANEYEGDPFNEFNAENKPFISFLQITLVPENFKESSVNYLTNHIYESEKELDRKVQEAIKDYSENIGIKYRIYKSVNMMDFCIVLCCDSLEFSTYLSNYISTIRIRRNDIFCAKYITYTVMGIHKKLKSNSIEILDNSILVARVQTNRNFWGNNMLQKDFNTFLSENKDESIDIHSLVGRYNLSIRIENKNEIIPTLKQMIYFKENSKCKHYENCNKLVDWLLCNKCVQYINERILIDIEKIIPRANQISTDYYVPDVKNLDEALKNCEKIKKLLLDYKVTILDEYMVKLENIILICKGLQNAYDVSVNMMMFSEYLVSFTELLFMNCEIIYSTKEQWHNIKINLIEGLNYLQQFIKISTSINCNSFQSPKSDIVQKECSIAKLPIAYSQFLNDTISAYYEFRKQCNDSEFILFPQYKALMIPFMQKTDSNFYMMSLFSQGISSDWNTEQAYWKKYVCKNSIPLFVVCQNLKHYSDISYVIISSFHEIGHYCNSITRRDRNTTLIRIFASIVAGEITYSYVTNPHISYKIQMATLDIDRKKEQFFEAIYQSICDILIDKLEEKITSPYVVFMKQLAYEIGTLIKPNPPYFHKNSLYENYIKYIKNIVKIKYDIDTVDVPEYTIDYHKALLVDIYNSLLSKAKLKLDEINTIIKNDKQIDSSEFNILINKGIEFIDYAANHIDNLLYDKETPAEDLFGSFKENMKSFKMYKTISQFIVEINDFMDYIVDSLRELALIVKNSNKRELLPLSEIEVDVSYKEKLIEKIINKLLESETLITESLNNTLTIDLYNKLFFMSDKTLDELKTLISEACIKSNIDVDEIEYWNTSYSESLADIVMCKNLNLDVVEYIILMSDIYDDDNIADLEKIKRFILVINFFYFEDLKMSPEAPEILSNWLFEQINKSNTLMYMLTDNNTLKDDYKNNDNEIANRVWILLCRISQKISDILSFTYRIIFDDLSRTSKNVTFIDKNTFESIKFIKKYIQNKVDFSTEKSKEISIEEIKFILKNYYKNRAEYTLKHM